MFYTEEEALLHTFFNIPEDILSVHYKRFYPLAYGLRWVLEIPEGSGYLQQIGGHCHFTTRDVGSKLLADPPKWKIANLKREIYTYYYTTIIQMEHTYTYSMIREFSMKMLFKRMLISQSKLTVVSGAR